MKKIAFMLIILSGSAYAQVPNYGLDTQYLLNTNPDTIKNYMLFDINNDSVSDIVYSTRYGLYFVNGVSGQPLRDSISCQPDFVFTLEKDSLERICIYYANLVHHYVGDSIIFKVTYFPLENQSEVDSVFMRIIWVTHGYPTEEFNGLSAISLFDLGFDVNSEILLSWNSIQLFDLISYIKNGYYCAADFTGNNMVNLTEVEQCIDINKYYYGNRPYISMISKYEYYSYIHGNSYYYFYSTYRVFNDSLRQIISNVYNNNSANFKILSDNDDNFQELAIRRENEVNLYDNPYLNNGVSHQMPCDAINSFFKYNGVQYILTGCNNSYFELRNLDMSLIAYIWGPNITISDAEPIDIDRDGTDDLLCRTANGFVLYRLNTATAISDNGGQLPENISMQIYPNPFNSELKIIIKGNSTEPNSVDIFNIAGQLVRDFQFSQ